MTKEATECYTEFHVQGLPRLSRSATRFLRLHPNEAQLVVVAALEAAAVQL